MSLLILAIIAAGAAYIAHSTYVADSTYGDHRAGINAMIFVEHESQPKPKPNFTLSADFPAIADVPVRFIPVAG